MQTKSYKTVWSPWLSEYPWQSIATLTCRGKISHSTAKDTLKKWRENLWKDEHIQLGYGGVVYSTLSQTHLHLLMMARNKYGKTLFDVDGNIWAKHWPGGRAEFEPIINKVGADYYIQKHMNPYEPDSWEWVRYGWKWWKKLRGKQSIYDA
ncbi:MAG: hypothetical protein ACLQVJ_25480 [Syntrophobacteraceae bacterium]